jgi:excinuclease UvrABC nuclease subunit
VDDPSIDLYRYYNADGVLLYVGISVHVAMRASQHRRTSDWWDEVARIDVEHLATRSRNRALWIEASVITAEQPAYNLAPPARTEPRRPSPPLAVISCAHCSTEFQPPNSRARYCSPLCRVSARRRVPTVMACARCGTTFERRSPTHRYCSTLCRWQARY